MKIAHAQEERMRYRKKPVVIEAVQFTEEMAKGMISLPEGVCLGRRSLGPPSDCFLYNYRFYIQTPEGSMNVEVGDWIITGIEGEKYPCKSAIFEKTYEIEDEFKP